MNILPFSESIDPVVPANPSDNTGAVTPGKQTNRMGLQVEIALTGADPLDGNYDVFVETALSDVEGDWTQTGDKVQSMEAPGVYRIDLQNPILDQVRGVITNDATNPGRATVTLTWLADREFAT